MPFAFFAFFAQRAPIARCVNEICSKFLEAIAACHRQDFRNTSMATSYSQCAKKLQTYSRYPFVEQTGIGQLACKEHDATVLKRSTIDVDSIECVATVHRLRAICSLECTIDRISRQCIWCLTLPRSIARGRRSSANQCTVDVHCNCGNSRSMSPSPSRRRYGSRVWEPLN